MKSIDHNFDVSKEFDLADLPNEIWKDIQGFEGLYQISSFGRVKSLGRFVVNPVTSKGYMWKPEKILKPCKHSKGYLFVGLHKDGYLKTVSVHRLVALAFIPNPQNLPQIDHINAVKTDNHVNNLRWVTAQENIRNPLNMEHLIGKRNPFYGKKHNAENRKKMKDNQVHRFGKDNPAARKVINLDTFCIFDTVKDAGAFYGVSDNSIRNSIKRNHKSAGCYWGYYTE